MDSELQARETLALWTWRHPSKIVRGKCENSWRRFVSSLHSAHVWTAFHAPGTAPNSRNEAQDVVPELGERRVSDGEGKGPSVIQAVKGSRASAVGAGRRRENKRRLALRAGAVAALAQVCGHLDPSVSFRLQTSNSPSSLCH